MTPQRSGQWIFHPAAEPITMPDYNRLTQAQWSDQREYMRTGEKGARLSREQKGKQGYWPHEQDHPMGYRYVTYSAPDTHYHHRRLMPYMRNPLPPTMTVEQDNWNPDPYIHEIPMPPQSMMGMQRRMEQERGDTTTWMDNRSPETRKAQAVNLSQNIERENITQDPYHQHDMSEGR